MDDLPAVKVGQSIQDALSHLPKCLLPSPAFEFLDLLVNTVKTPSFAELHGNGDSAGGFVHERPVIAAYVLRGAVFIKVELTNDLLLDIGIWVCSDDLPS